MKTRKASADRLDIVYLLSQAPGFGSDIPTGYYFRWDVPVWHSLHGKGSKLSELRSGMWGKWERWMKKYGSQPLMLPQQHIWMGTRREYMVHGAMSRYGSSRSDREAIIKMMRKRYDGEFNSRGYVLKRDLICPFEIWFTSQWDGSLDVLRRPIGHPDVRGIIREFPESWWRFEQQTMQKPTEVMPKLIRERRGFAQLVAWMRMGSSDE